MMDPSSSSEQCASCVQHFTTGAVSLSNSTTSSSAVSNPATNQRPVLTLDSTTRLHNHSATMNSQSFLENGSLIGSINTNTATTPIRPRPILPSLSYSFDSGYEVSPICLRSFAYGDSVLEQHGSQLGGTSADSDADSSIRKHLHQDNLVDEAVVMNSFDDERDEDDDESANDSIVGYDKELISIEQHFTPITSPNASIAAAAAATANIDAGNNATNLASQRRTNRSHRQLSEVNNNDVFFPNQNPPLAQQDQSLFDEMFLLDEGDDDVFLSEEEMEEEEDSDDVVEPRLWHLHRPSCIISETEPELASSRTQPGQHNQSRHSDYNRNWLRRHVRLQSEDSLHTSSSGSRRSSTPIPIPGSTSSSGSTSLSDQELFDEFDAGGPFSFDPSVPSGTRMPYYHPMAPPLNLPPVSSLLGSSASSPPLATGNRHIASNALRRANLSNGTNTFGTRFETSCSIISRNMIPPSRYSPPPLPFFNWYHNVNRLNRSGSPFLFQFGRLSPTALAGQSPQQAAYRSIPNDFRVLSPHFEADEYNQPNDVDMAASSTTPSSSYGLIFNFSQFDSQLDGAVGDGNNDNHNSSPTNSHLSTTTTSTATTIGDNGVALDIRRQRRTMLPDLDNILAEETEEEANDIISLGNSQQISDWAIASTSASSSSSANFSGQSANRAVNLSEPSAPSVVSSTFNHRHHSSTTADLSSATTTTMSIDLDIVPKIERQRRRHYSQMSEPNNHLDELPNHGTQSQSNYHCPLPDVIATVEHNLRNQNTTPVSGSLSPIPAPNYPNHYRRSSSPPVPGSNGADQMPQHHRHRIIKHRNTLPSFHEVPSAAILSCNNEQCGTNAQVGGANSMPHQRNQRNTGATQHNHGTEPRRTMSVSLPIDERTIRTVAGQLRRISDDFSLQVQRHNPLLLRSLLDLLVNHFLSNFQSNAAAAATAGAATQNPQSRNAPGRSVPRSPRTTTTTVPTPTTTGNSTFYLGSTTTTTVKSKLGHFDHSSPPPN